MVSFSFGYYVVMVSLTAGVTHSAPYRVEWMCHVVKVTRVCVEGDSGMRERGRHKIKWET